MIGSEVWVLNDWDYNAYLIKSQKSAKFAEVA